MKTWYGTRQGMWNVGAGFAWMFEKMEVQEVGDAIRVLGVFGYVLAIFHHH